MPGLCGLKETLNCCFLWAPLVVRLGSSVTWKLSLYAILSLSLFSLHFIPPPPPPIFVCTFWAVLFLIFSLPPLLLSVHVDLFRSLFSIYSLCCCLYVLICSVPLTQSTAWQVRQSVEWHYWQSLTVFKIWSLGGQDSFSTTVVSITMWTMRCTKTDPQLVLSRGYYYYCTTWLDFLSCGSDHEKTP